MWLLHKLAHGLGFVCGICFIGSIRITLELIFFFGVMIKSYEIMLWCEEAEEAILEWIDRWEEAEAEKDD